MTTITKTGCLVQICSLAEHAYKIILQIRSHAHYLYFLSFDLIYFFTS